MLILLPSIWQALYTAHCSKWDTFLGYRTGKMHRPPFATRTIKWRDECWEKGLLGLPQRWSKPTDFYYVLVLSWSCTYQSSSKTGLFVFYGEQFISLPGEVRLLYTVNMQWAVACLENWKCKWSVISTHICQCSDKPYMIELSSYFALKFNFGKRTKEKIRNVNFE